MIHRRSKTIFSAKTIGTPKQQYARQKNTAVKRKRKLERVATTKPPYLFWKKQDWKRLREEFFTDTAEDGSYKYKNVREFMQAKFKDKLELKWARSAVGRRMPT